MNFTNKLRLLFLAIILIGSSYAIGFNSNTYEIVHVESQNEMTPEEFIDNFLIVVKNGDNIKELEFNIETKETILISEYNLKDGNE